MLISAQKMYFTDSWSRIRTEGYGFLTIPLEAGSYHDLIVETWRPLTPNHINEMKRYFVGGTPELEDLAYCGNTKDAALLSRYGFRTVTSGQIRVRMNIIHQSKALLQNVTKSGAKMKWKRAHLMDRLATQTLFSSLTAVMEAFKRAREKIAQATEGFDSADVIA